jgi:DNA invertase Pin-like site-specific DNA recombinase
MPSHQPNLGAQIPHRSFPTWSYLSAVMDMLENTDDAGDRTQLVQASRERNLIRERIRTGLEAARTCGRKGGRPKQLQAKELKTIRALLKTPRFLCRK